MSRCPFVCVCLSCTVSASCHPLLLHRTPWQSPPSLGGRSRLPAALHLPLLSARSRLSALAGCCITTSCDAAAYHPSALLPLVCRFPSSTHTLHHFHASLSNNDGVHCAGTSIFQMFQFRLTQKWYQCSPHRANCAKPRRALVADSVSRLMVQGREHSTMGSGRTMVRSGRGPISYPIGQPSWS